MFLLFVGGNVHTVGQIKIHLIFSIVVVANDDDDDNDDVHEFNGTGLNS